MLLRTRNHSIQLLIALSSVALGHAVAEDVEVSSPIGMVIAGLLYGSYTKPRFSEQETRSLTTFWHGIEEILTALLFVMIGLSVVVVHPVSWAHFPTIATGAIMVCLVARALSVRKAIAPLNHAGILNADGSSLTQLVTWGGLRDGLALALALSLPGSPEQATIVHMTCSVVISSILVQGATIGRLFPLKILERIIRSTWRRRFHGRMRSGACPVRRRSARGTDLDAACAVGRASARRRGGSRNPVGMHGFPPIGRDTCPPDWPLTPEENQ